LLGKVLDESYHTRGSPDKPPRKPLGILKVHMLIRLRHVPSDWMLHMRVVPANANEKKHAITLFDAGSLHVKSRRLVAGTQYSSQSLREAALKREQCRSFRSQEAHAHRCFFGVLG
jgi:hypothetical protein